MPQETCSGAFFAAETAGTLEQPGHEPLESHGNLGQFSTQTLDHLVDHTAAHQGFADYSIPGPLGPVHEEVTNGHGKVVIGVHQPRRWGDDSMAVRVCVNGGCNVVYVFMLV